ncbi:MAG: hypothetical protein V3U02_04390 [Calditrichia bacterium]
MDDQRKCCRCKNIKFLYEFYHHKGKRDGLDYHCKECQNKAVSRYLKTDKGKISRSKANKAYRVNNPLKMKSHDMVDRALKTGKLIKPNICDECTKKRKLEGHHKDYSKPLDVQWLCKKCHNKKTNKYDY